MPICRESFPPINQKSKKSCRDLGRLTGPGNSYSTAGNGQFGNVRFGSKADIGVGPRHVRFTPESGHQLAALGCLLSAKSKLAAKTVKAIHARQLSALLAGGLK